MAEHQLKSVPELEPLGHPAYPTLAAAIRKRKEHILQRFEETRKKILPKLDRLTHEQVRDHIPQMIDYMADAFEQGQRNVLHTVVKLAGQSGQTRFHEGYDHEGLIIEYRLLRRIVKEELMEEMGEGCTPAMHLALDVGVDLAMQESVLSFTRYQSEQLRSAAAAESRYLAFLSHDLRNHLNSVMLTLQVLEPHLNASPDFAEDAEDLRSAQRSITETLQGMERLIQLDRLRSPAGRLQVTEVDLPQLAREVVAQASSAAKEKGLSFEVQIPADAALHTDRQLLFLAIQNILNNAVKYSAQGTIRISAQFEADQDRWRLSISDQGPGIAPEDLNRLFNAFNRGDTHGQPGAGLGLTIAARAIDALGGQITVDSQVGNGSTFHLLLPAKPPQGTA